MKKCTFIYKPTYLYLSASDSLDEAKDEDYLWTDESFANGFGTFDYQIEVDGKLTFEFTIPLDYIEEEDLDLQKYEGKILTLEINQWSTQTLNAFIEEGENMKPFSTHLRLAYSFNGILFGDDPNDPEYELQKYDPLDYESEDRYFEYYRVIEGKAILIES